MTDARFCGEWTGQPWFLEIDLATRGLLASALAWCAQNGTDGAINRRAFISLTPDFAFPGKDVSVLESLGKLEHVDEDNWQFVGWNIDVHKGGLNQRTAAQVAESNAGAAERMRRKRAHDKGNHSLCTSKCSMRNATGDVMRDVTRNATGDVGEGKGEGNYTDPHLLSNGGGENAWLADPDDLSADDHAVEVDGFRVNARTGELVDVPGSRISNATLPADSPMGVAAAIRSELRAPDPGYCSECGRTFVAGVCPKCSVKKVRAA